MHELYAAFLAGSVVSVGCLALVRSFRREPELPVSTPARPALSVQEAADIASILVCDADQDFTACHSDGDIDVMVEWIPKRQMWKETVNGRYRMQRSLVDVRRSLVGRLTNPNLAKSPPQARP